MNVLHPSCARRRGGRLQFSGGGSKMAVSGDGQTTQLWQITTTTRKALTRGHTDHFRLNAFARGR